MAEMTAPEAVTLKEQIKNEMSRRQYNGSMVAYAGSEYDFATTPTSGAPMSAQQGNAIIEPLNAVNPIDGLSTAQSGEPIPAAFDNSNLTTVVTNLASLTTEASNAGCAAACSGLCQNQCSTGCTGCSSCTSCTGCSGTCSGVCRNSCSRNCTGDCDGCSGCSAACRNNCTGSCDGCSGCSANCKNTCDVSCKTGCSSCKNGCTGSCNGCQGCSGTQSTSRPSSGAVCSNNGCSTTCTTYCKGSCVSSCGACSGCSGARTNVAM